jgi:hypothetical protein
MRFAHPIVYDMMELNLLELLFLESSLTNFVTDLIEDLHRAQERTMLKLVRYQFYFENRLHYNDYSA